MSKLQNNHNVYILGAGFSVDRGLPTINNFMNVMRDAHQWLELQSRTKEADAIAKVLDFRLDAASAAYRIRLNLENIEELFSLASASSRTLTQNIQLAIAATLDFKLKTSPEPKIGFQASKLLANVPISWTSEEFDGFVSTDPNYYSVPAYEFYLKSMLGNWDNASSFSDNTFISFNYDLLIESALRGLSIPYTYGFESKNYDPSEGVQVLKLHGSINWAKKEKSLTSYDIYSSYNELVDSNHIPQLVPPTWRKIFTGPLRNIWDKSLKSLEQATRIIIIGFSIPPTDNHFKYLLAAGLQKNISLREIVFINPEQTLLEERANSLFGDIAKSSSVRVIGQNLSQFVSQGINNQVIGGLGRQIPNNIQNIYLK